MLVISRIRWLRCLLVAIPLLWSFSVHAQTSNQPSPAAADPLDPLARVPQTTYQSPLANYRKLGEDQPTSWREANETVNRIGGWRAYAREALQPGDAPASPSSGGGSAGAPGGHGKH
jgi:hypothetical protein